MSELSDLYQEVILDHHRRPRNYQVVPGANRVANGHNPLCGDHLTLYLRMEGEVIGDVGFQGSGCAISKASASMMTDAVKGWTKERACALLEKFHGMVTGGAGSGAGGAPVDTAEMGKLAAFAGVCEFPARVKCATLAWHTLRAALDGKDEPVSTE
ncbi:MAG: SUF system NifU family Fe-S cluster assembly protein [Planctomycetes bacterium]|nr:SUF system NifU family Fe-S cluster assembly protein [Planctomycetota bacterium]